MRTLSLTLALALLSPWSLLAHRGPRPTDRIDVAERAPVELGLEDVPLVEPFLVAHPTDPALLVGAAMRVDRPDWRLVVFRSENGGAAWTVVPLPGMPEGRIAGDPWLTWRPSGELLLSMVKFVPAGDDERVAVWLYRSGDDGATWQGPEQLPWTASGSFDHPVLTGPPDRPGPLFVAATYGASGFLVLRADGPGDEFEIAGRFVPDELNNNLGSAVALGGDRLVFTHFDMSTPGPERPLWAVRSADGGATFERTLIRRGVMPWGFPMLAAGPGDDAGARPLYAVWVEPDAEGGLDVMLSRSDDASRWSEPMRVNDGPAAFRGAPFVAVNRAGTIGVQWSDWRHGDDEEFCSDVYFAASTDGGASFLPEVRVSSQTACALTEPNARAARRWRMGGDYSGMAADAQGRFHPIWADARTGVFQLYSAVVSVGDAPTVSSGPRPREAGVAEQPHVEVDVAVSPDSAPGPRIEPHLAVNPRDPDHLVGAAVELGEPTTVATFLSRDGGRTWSRTSVPDCWLDPWLGFLPDGRVALACIDHEDRAGVAIRASEDGGRSWEPASRVPFVEGELSTGEAIDRVGSYDHEAFIAATLEGTATLYLVAMQAVHTTGDEDRAGPVFLALPLQDGDEAPAQHPDTVRRFIHGNVWANTLNPVTLGAGAVGFAYVDFGVAEGEAMRPLRTRRAWWVRSDDGSGSREGCHEMRFSASGDGGERFTEPITVRPGSCPDSGSGARRPRWPWGGDYFGMAGLPDGGFQLLWSHADEGRYDLRSARIAVPAPGTR